MIHTCLIIIQIYGTEWLSVSNVRRATAQTGIDAGSERGVHLFALSPTHLALSPPVASPSPASTCTSPAKTETATDSTSDSASVQPVSSSCTSESAPTDRPNEDAEHLLLEPVFTHELHGAECDEGVDVDVEREARGARAQMRGARVLHVQLSGGDRPLLLSGSDDGSLHLWRPRLLKS